MFMPFGKYTDRPLTEVPEPYLMWLVVGATDDDLDADLRHAIWAELRRRTIIQLTRDLARARRISPPTLRLVCEVRRQMKLAGVAREELRPLNREIMRLVRLARHERAR